MCPVFEGRAVLADITEPKTVENKFKPGETKEEIFFVYEVDTAEPNGKRHTVRSKPLNASAAFSTKLKDGKVKKSGLCEHIEALFGRPLNAQELAGGIDVDALLGTPAYIEVVHTTIEGKTYANIDRIRPHKASAGEKLTVSPDYVRAKDRQRDGDDSAGATPATGGAASYRTATQGDDVGREDWQTVKVCVGKFAGTELGDLDLEDVKKLVTGWLPTFAANPKPTADEKRLAAALGSAAKEIAVADDAPAY